MSLTYNHIIRCFSNSAKLMRRPNIQSPLVPGTERRILEAITVPIFPEDVRPLPISCHENQKKEEATKKFELSEAYKAFKLKQAIHVFKNSKMVAICHALPMTSRDFLAVKTKIMKAGMNLVFMRNDLAIKATEGTRLNNLVPFFKSDNFYVVCDETLLSELIKALRKISELQLLGGLVEDRILSRDAILKAAKLPPLDTLHGELLTILNASTRKTSQILGQHQQTLSQNLEQLVRQGTEE